LKDKIIDISLQQFLEHGIRDTSMQKLVLALGISTKTMYGHFNNKEELLEECLKKFYSESGKGITRFLEGSPNPVVSLSRVYAKAIDLDFGTNHLFYHDLNYYYPQLQDKVIKQYASASIQTVIKLIEQGVDEGYFLSYLRAPVVLETLTLLFTSVTRYPVYENFGKKRELVKHTIAIYLRGICTEKGLHEINQLKELFN